MSFHLGAFYENIDAAGALVELAAVQDQVVTTSGDDMRVPVNHPYLLGAAAAIEATGATQVQVTTPSLRRISPTHVIPFDTGLVIDSGLKVMLHPDTPIQLVGDESMNFLHNNNPAAATDQYGLVWFGDGPVQPVSGEIFTIRCTMSITAVLGSWVNGNLTFPQDLPIGNYDVVGMRVVQATIVAGRLSFVGGTVRPGVAGVATLLAEDNHYCRFGRMGVWGSFHTNTPPTVDILAAAGAITPVVFLDVIARG